MNENPVQQQWRIFAEQHQLTFARGKWSRWHIWSPTRVGVCVLQGVYGQRALSVECVLEIYNSRANSSEIYYTAGTLSLTNARTIALQAKVPSFLMDFPALMAHWGSNQVSVRRRELEMRLRLTSQPTQVAKQLLDSDRFQELIIHGNYGDLIKFSVQDRLLAFTLRGGRTSAELQERLDKIIALAERLEQEFAIETST